MCRGKRRKERCKYFFKPRQAEGVEEMCSDWLAFPLFTATNLARNLSRGLNGIESEETWRNESKSKQKTHQMHYRSLENNRTLR